MDKIYVIELDKPPLDEDTLAHYGVLGMKWGIRKNPERAMVKSVKKANKYTKKIYKANKKYIKEAKKVSRFFGRKRAQEKVVRLNAKKDYLTAKRDKWVKKTTDVMDKEIGRILKDKNSSTGYSIDPEKALKIKRISDASRKSGFNNIYAEYKSRKSAGNSLVDKKKPKTSNVEHLVDNAKNKSHSNSSSNNTHKTSSHIENKVASAKKTGKYDMDFLERELDIDQKTGEPLKGKALDDAYRKYLKNKK